jgi:signal transduction histidine kinase
LLLILVTHATAPLGAVRWHIAESPRGQLQSLQSTDMPEERGRRGSAGGVGSAQSLGPAATAIILLLGGVISVLGWVVMRRQLEIEMGQQTSLYASTLAEVVESHVGGLYSALHRRAELWSDARQSPEFWQPSVELFLRENPALLAISHSDPSRPALGTGDGIRVLHDLMPAIQRSAADAEGDFAVGPVLLEGNRPVFGLRVRTELADPPGEIFAAFDPAIALKALLDERALGYGLRITVGDQELYRRVPPDAEMMLDLTYSDSVALGVGHSWSLSAWPTSSTVLGFYDQGPLLVLAAGLAASALIALSVHYGTLAWRRSDALRATNLELEQQIEVSRRGRGDLEELSAELEARVAQRTAELHETIVELETFNYSVSHDLRGPLGAVINFAAILREDYESSLDAQGKDILSRIVHSASAAVSMMDALLAYSRSGRTELHKAPLDVTRLVNEVVAEFTAVTPSLSCAVKMGDLPDVVADESMLRFIFTNLISNACKFAREDHAASVEIGGSVAGNEATYFVRDEGVGFDMRFSEKLFRVFERLHSADSYPGHGVGLAIVARMVRRHGGRVWAQGAVGKGATFYFTIPVLEGGNDGRSQS